MNELLELVRRPHVTEKTTRLKEENRVLCFRVQSGSTKVAVRQAVERIFGVKVQDVRIVSVKPKPKRNRGFAGHRSGWRKAYVTLRPGEKSIEYFEGV